MLFWTSALASTIPTPSGVFIPVLKMGAAYGRLLGELMAAAYPNGIKYSHPAAIVPGSYAVVGAAAFSGAVTHTVSTSVILFEMTGQIVHIIPVILGVLISNAVCQSLQPSIYDSIIEIKKLPYLPPIASSNSISHRILVREFMNTNMPFVWKEKCTYAELKSLLSSHKKIMSFPLVESPDSMKLLGSIARPDLLKLLYLHLGRERRLQEVCRRNSDTLSPAIHLLNTISGRLSSASGAGAGECGSSQEGDPEGATNEMKLRRSESAPQASAQPKSANLGHEGPSYPQTVAVQAENGDHRGHSYSSSDESEVRNRGTAVDATRLIVRASQPQNYGATENDDGQKKATAASDKAGALHVPTEEQLLSDCHKDAGGADSKPQLESIAKIINHYDRGTSMDEEHLDKSIQEVEDHLANVNKSPAEIMVMVAPKPVDEPQRAPNQHLVEHTSSGRALVWLDDGSLPRQPYEPTLTRKAVDLSGSETTTPVQPNLPQFNFHILTPNPAKPTKSILKTSSFNSMTKRNISAHSLSSGNSIDVSYSNTIKNRQMTNNYLKYSLASMSNTNHRRMNSTTTATTTTTIANEQARGKQHTFIIGDGGQSTQSGADKLSMGEIQQPPIRRKVRLPSLRVVDMTPEEQEQWEKEQLDAYIDISKCQIDEAPFQLVEQTSLYRVHTLFSMLGLNHAYVTSFGRLVGIVALKDIRFALERMLQEK